MLRRLSERFMRQLLGSLANAADLTPDADARLVLPPKCLPGTGRPTAQILRFPVKAVRDLTTSAAIQIQAVGGPADRRRTQI